MRYRRRSARPRRRSFRRSFKRRRSSHRAVRPMRIGYRF